LKTHQEINLSIYQFFCPQKSNQRRRRRRRRKPTSKGILQNMNQYTEDLINDHHTNTHTLTNKKTNFCHTHKKLPQLESSPRHNPQEQNKKAARKKQNTSQVSK